MQEIGHTPLFGQLESLTYDIPKQIRRIKMGITAHIPLTNYNKKNLLPKENLSNYSKKKSKSDNFL